MSDTPIVDRIKTYKQRCDEHPEHQSGMVTHGMCYARMNEECEEVYAVARDLERMCAELYARLNYTRDYVNEAVNKHLRMYGENYPSKNLQLAALRKELTLVDAALAKWQAMQPNVKLTGAGTASALDAGLDGATEGR